MPADLWNKVQGRYRHYASRLLFRRPLVLCTRSPLISFTFDDFPESAWTVGGQILQRYGARGTYYAAFSLLGKVTPNSKMFSVDDAKCLLREGHELGCHTFDHFHAWRTSAGDFEASIVKNRQALEATIPGTTFGTLSYPYSEPRPLNKRAAGKYFPCCRAGHRDRNIGTIDLNGLGARFLEQYRGEPSRLKTLVDRNCRERGWLIFATHDISTNPSPFGCTAEFFEDIVRYAAQSGSRILPVVEAYKALVGASSEVNRSDSAT